MLNPQQSININISYNLNPDKPTKLIQGRKILRNNKIVSLDPDPKLKKNNQNALKKSNQRNQRNQRNERNERNQRNQRNQRNELKRHRKKQPSYIRNAITPELHLQERRLKTESALHYMTEDQSTTKKDKYLARFAHKATFAGCKKPPLRSKSKFSHIKSCMLDNSQPRKIALEIGQHAVSTLVALPAKRRRTMSAAISKNDRVVSKLLNMSLLASELGGSQLVTSERNNTRKIPFNLKEFVSSMDMRMIRSMENDFPHFSKPQGEDIVKAILIRRSIPLQQLTRKCLIIQREWRKRLRVNVMGLYHKLFRSVTDKIKKANAPLEAKRELFCQKSGREKECLFEIAYKISECSEVEPKQDQMMGDQMEIDLPLSEPRYKKIMVGTEAEQRVLNIPKYKELVNQSIQQLSHFKEEQIEKWNSIHEKISSIMNDKTSISSTALLDELIKQSNNNRKLIEYDFPEKQMPAINLIQTEDGVLDEPQNQSFSQYDRRKYAHSTNGEDDSPKEVSNRSQEPLETDVVRNYLDCGLQGFGFPLPNYESDESIGMRFEQANNWDMHFQEDSSAAVSTQSHSPQKVQRKMGLIIEEVINFLYEEFAVDISYILKKSNGHMTQQPKCRGPPRMPGISASFDSAKAHLSKLISFLSSNPDCTTHVFNSLNTDIGPTSQDILKYLRPDYEEETEALEEITEEQYQEERRLYVIPQQMHQAFQEHLERQYFQEHKKPRLQSTRAILNIWHRCLFESMNQCLDYQRPHGIQGSPYAWVTHVRQAHFTSQQAMFTKIEKAKQRLLEMASYVSGIMFEKEDSPFSAAQLTDDQKLMINEERLSRMLAKQLFELESSWVVYNDETVQLLMELSKIIQERLFIEMSTEIRRVQRNRKMLSEQARMEQPVSFSIDQL